MNTNTNTNTINKNEIFMDADFYQISARECYEMAEALEAEHNSLAEGWREEAQEYEWKFGELLKQLVSLGWDREYMGIA